MRKLFSATFYALIATLQKEFQTFEKLTTFFFKKYLALMMRMESPKEQILDILPFIVGKAILIAFSEKIREPLIDVMECD